MDEYSPVRLPVNVENMQLDDDNMTIQRIQKRSKVLKKSHQRTKSLEVQKIRKSVKDEKTKSYYKPLLFANTMFYIYSIQCLVDLWRSQTSNTIVK